MGQVQSEEPESSENSGSQDASDLELNSGREAPVFDVRAAKLATSGGPRRRLEGWPSPGATKTTTQSKLTAREQQHVRKLSNVSHRNIQLLSIKPRSEKDAYADELRTRRRSSLINLILGAPSSGPRFSDDLCSLSSHITECNFGIEFFPDAHHCSNTSLSSLAFEEGQEDAEKGAKFNCKSYDGSNQKRRRSSLGSLVGSQIATAGCLGASRRAPPGQERRKLNLANTLASIDLSGSFEVHAPPSKPRRPPLAKCKPTIFESLSQEVEARARLNQRVLRRTGSELSLYSTVSAGSGAQANQLAAKKSGQPKSPLRETKSIIILQVCLPFILAGFGNMLAGLILNRLARWRSFQMVPTFFVLLPSFVGLKGNIEMTFASRLSTLANLNLLDTGYQRRRIYVSNLALILSQAVALSTFAALVAVACELVMLGAQHASPAELVQVSLLVVLASALATAVVLVILSSLVVSLSVSLANLIKVNPDNLSTLVAALYGDASCVLIYGFFADLMFGLWEQNRREVPAAIVCSSIIALPLLLFAAYRLKETKGIAFSSLPPMLTAILVSMGSGAVLAHFVERFKLIALYQPVVNGFGANLIAVQASRVSTWLWCSELRRLSLGQARCEVRKKKNLGSLASFSEPSKVDDEPEEKGTVNKEQTIAHLFAWPLKSVKLVFWSFLNSSPNAVAARLLLLMLVPAHTIYFFSIWLLSPAGYIALTWQFYLVYVTLCVTQVFILLTLCEPLMSLFMRLDLDPDIFGISLLMALADLTGTLCLAGAFTFLAQIDDLNAI